MQSPIIQQVWWEGFQPPRPPKRLMCNILILHHKIGEGHQQQYAQGLVPIHSNGSGTVTVIAQKSASAVLHLEPCWTGWPLLILVSLIKLSIGHCVSTLKWRC